MRSVLSEGTGRRSPSIASIRRASRNISRRSRPSVRAYVAAIGFEPKPGAILLAPSPEGELARVIFGVEAPGASGFDPFLAGKLAGLPAGSYAFERAPSDPAAAALAFLLASYQFRPLSREARGKAASPRASGG